VVAELWNLVGASILGVMPKEGFSDPSSPDHGAVVIAVAGETAQGLVAALPLEQLRFKTGEEEIEIEERETKPGSDAGSVVLLVDGSGSMSGSDPQRLRVNAVEVLAAEISECSDDWSQSLFEFTTDVGWGQMQHSRSLADFGSDVHTISTAASQLKASGGTPLWDAAREIIAGLGGVAQQHEEDLVNEGLLEAENDAAYSRTIIVISDGADTDSHAMVEDVVALANKAGVQIHSIGIGPASDANLVNLDPTAIQDLRKLSLKTGGYYGFVDSIDDLPTHAKTIAQSLCEGYDELVLRFPEGARDEGRVFATMVIGETGIEVPFTFTAP
jgi:uncharacterized protein YegL